MQLNRKLKANKKVIDYPSSSEMSSADTVIFIGKNGKKNYLKKSINNNQLLLTKPTDRINKPKLGVFSNYYNSKNRSSSSSSSSNEPITTLTKPNEIWIDGPKNSASNHHQELRQLATKILTPSLNDIKLNEIWIDGPKCSKLKTVGVVESSFESLECLDRQLLKQLNDHDMDMHDSVNLNRINSSTDSSRPISLLSVKSNDTTNNSISTVSSLITLKEDPSSSSSSLVEETSGHSYKQKLEDLKQSYDQMIFKQSYKEMESLHKTLETFLNLDQTSKLKMMMKPIKSTVLTPACDLNKQFTTNMDSLSSQKSQTTKMTTNEKEKRLSRILSPTRFRPTPQIPNHSSSSSSTTTTSSDSSSSSSSSSSSCSSVVLSSPNTNNYSIPLKHLTSSPIIASKRTALSPVSFEKFSPLFTKINNNNSNNEQQYSEPFDNLNRTIEKNLNQILKNSSNNDLNNSLLLVKNINASRPLHNRMSKNETNRLFYNFNNQNHVIGSHHLNGYRSSVNEQLQQQSYLAQPVFIPTSSVPSTPNQNRKKSNQDKITVTSSFKEIKNQKESILTRIFHRSKSTNKNTNQNLNLSNYSKERVVSANSNNTSGFSESLLDKNSSNFNSMIGGTDLLTSSSGYESLSKENTNNSSNSTNDDSSDCLTTSSESGDVKYSTFNRVKSGKIY
jgi:trimeric autotransporter adhesin